MRRPDLDEVCAPAPDSPLGQLIEGATSFYMDFYAAVVGEDGCRLHDPLALAVAIDPSLARLETTRVEVETEGRWTIGETVADLAGIRGSPWPVGWEPEANARVAFDVDAEDVHEAVRRTRAIAGGVAGVTGSVVVIGAINVDLVVSGAPLPAPGQTVTGGVFAQHHGGKGGNQAVAAARALGGGPGVVIVGRGRERRARPRRPGRAPGGGGGHVRRDAAGRADRRGADLRRPRTGRTRSRWRPAPTPSSRRAT